jgi:hypothetical protein
VIVVVPAATPVATPPLDVMVAVDVLDELQLNVAEDNAVPSAFLAVAVNVCVAPTVIVSVLGETVTVATVTSSPPGSVGESEPPPPQAARRNGMKRRVSRIGWQLVRMFVAFAWRLREVARSFSRRMSTACVSEGSPAACLQRYMAGIR